MFNGDTYTFEVLNYHLFNENLEFYQVRLPEWLEQDSELLFIQRNNAEFREEALRLLESDPHLIPPDDGPELIGEGVWMWNYQVNRRVDFAHMVARVERVL